MTTATTTNADALTIADLLHRLGDIPPERVRLQPPPGQATVDDVVRIEAREDRLFELIDGTLVEKGMGYRESLLAGFLIHTLLDFILRHNLPLLVTGEAGMMRLTPGRQGQVRMPDVAVTRRERFPGQRAPQEPVPLVAPDLAIEVLSKSNTKAEIDRKRREYFDHGASMVWVVDPVARTVESFAAGAEPVALTEADTLSGEPLLPGFALPLAQLFAVLD